MPSILREEHSTRRRVGSTSGPASDSVNLISLPQCGQVTHHAERRHLVRRRPSAWLQAVHACRAVLAYRQRWLVRMRPADATFGILRPDPGRDVLRHGGRPAGATGGGPAQGTGGASRSEPGDDLRPVQRRANQPSRTAKSSMISALTLLRTLFYGRSSHTAGLPGYASAKLWCSRDTRRSGRCANVLQTSPARHRSIARVDFRTESCESVDVWLCHLIRSFRMIVYTGVEHADSPR